MLTSLLYHDFSAYGCVHMTDVTAQLWCYLFFSSIKVVMPCSKCSMPHVYMECCLLYCILTVWVITCSIVVRDCYLMTRISLQLASTSLVQFATMCAATEVV